MLCLKHCQPTTHRASISLQGGSRPDSHPATRALPLLLPPNATKVSAHLEQHVGVRVASRGTRAPVATGQLMALPDCHKQRAPAVDGLAAVSRQVCKGLVGHSHGQHTRLILTHHTQLVRPLAAGKPVYVCICTGGSRTVCDLTEANAIRISVHARGYSPIRLSNHQMVGGTSICMCRGCRGDLHSIRCVYFQPTACASTTTARICERSRSGSHHCWWLTKATSFANTYRRQCVQARVGCATVLCKFRPPGTQSVRRT